MSHDFDEQYWENHWRDAGSSDAPHPCLRTELAGLAPGRALDAGCGEGMDALWLAEQGWQVTAVDISATALARAWARRAVSRTGCPGSRPISPPGCRTSASTW